jgi:AraC-like DNA-binding protein
MIMKKGPPVNEQVRIWRIPGLPQLELMRATYIRQSFARHSHEGFAVGVIEDGALGFFYRGENVIAAKGAINLANPDEPHTGRAAHQDGWTYRMFYLHADALHKTACQIAGHPVAMPFFQSGVLQDDALAGMIRHVHRALEDKRNPSLEKESLFLLMLSHLIRRHADAPPKPLRIGSERSAAQRTRDFIEAHSSEDISIHQLASIAHMSPYHFIRIFYKAMGLPPHSYLLQARARKAKSLIAQGSSIAAAALEAGFADQSHLTRHYKRIFGITPGQFRNFVQYGHSGAQP